MRDDIKGFFLAPKTAKHRQYEALRAYVVEGVSAQEAAERFGFTQKSLYDLAHSLRAGELDFFPKRVTGPKDRRITPYVRENICELRKGRLSVKDIVERLAAQQIQLSHSTVERILNDAGFGKLSRRTRLERGLSKERTSLAAPAQDLDVNALKPFRAECQVAGIFFFLPYIIESGLLEALDGLPLPGSHRIGKTQAFLSLLALKLMGGERLSHVRQYDHDVGFGLFAGLNVLPKPTYVGSYSCLVSAKDCHRLQKELVTRLRSWAPSFFSGSTINLDFHSIPHFGEASEMEKVWCGTRNKAIKGANTFFAQDAETKTLLYANADVLRRDGANEIIRFIEYLRAIKGIVGETLVFDSRLTTYKVLGELDDAGVKFITLRTRSKSLIEWTESLPDAAWRRVRLPIPKRRRQAFLAHESEVTLRGSDRTLRHIVMKDHGRAKPTYVITNNREMSLVSVLTVYARRWRIENKLAELVGFFNINALSSPIMVRIHFDLLLSVAASFLYHCLANDLPRFEKKLAPDIFRRFIDMPGMITYDGTQFALRIRKRAHTPILLGLEKLNKPITVPWLNGKTISISFNP
jgi:transposase